jgi:hypothetical protein
MCLTKSKQPSIILLSCRSGEIGIRTRLKIWRGQLHVGSTPTSGISKSKKTVLSDRLFSFACWAMTYLAAGPAPSEQTRKPWFVPPEKLRFTNSSALLSLDR